MRKSILFCSFILLCGNIFSAGSQESSLPDEVEPAVSESEAKARFFEWMLKLRKLQSAAVAQSSYDVKYYKLNLDIDPVAEWLSGYVDVEAVADREISMIELNLMADMAVDSVTGDTREFSRQGDLLLLNFPEPAGPGERFSVRIYYQGKPASAGFGGFVFDSQNGVPMVWTLSEPYFARSWWPCKDLPSDKADSVSVIVTVPQGMTATSNGLLLNHTENEDGTGTFHWFERYPITTYLVSLAITNYAAYSQWFRYSDTDSMEITNYIYPADLARARDELADPYTPGTGPMPVQVRTIRSMYTSNSCSLQTPIRFFQCLSISDSGILHRIL